MAPFTTPTDVLARWVSRPVEVNPDEDQLKTLIADAEDVVLAEFPDILSRIESGDIPATRFVRIVSRVVVRHLNNPLGWRQQTQGDGPFTRGGTFAGNTPGELYLTDKDREELAGIPSVRRAFMVDLAPGFTREGQ